MPTQSTQDHLEALTHGATDRLHGIIQGRILSAYYLGKEDAVAVIELLRTVCHQAVWTAPEPLAQYLSYVLKVTDPQHGDPDTAAAIRAEIMTILDKYTPKDTATSHQHQIERSFPSPSLMGEGVGGEGLPTDSAPADTATINDAGQHRHI